LLPLVALTGIDLSRMVIPFLFNEWQQDRSPAISGFAKH